MLLPFPVDLAKNVFQVAVADDTWKVVEQYRLTRLQFERWCANRPAGLVVMEACGSAHHWARWLNSLGVEVRLLPAAYIRAYVKRNTTDAADACALLEAARCARHRAGPGQEHRAADAAGCGERHVVGDAVDSLMLRVRQRVARGCRMKRFIEGEDRSRATLLPRVSG